MPTAHTKYTIYNLALDVVQAFPVVPGDQRKEFRWLERNFEHYVRMALRRDLWNFAMELHELNRTDDPVQRWTRAYDLPNGWLRVVPPTYDGCRNGRPIPYEVKSQNGAMVLMTNEYSYMRVELVMDRQSPGEWDDLFANVVAMNLAVGLSHSLTHKASFTQLAKQNAIDAYDIAAQVNAFESPGPDNDQHDVIRERYR